MQSNHEAPNPKQATILQMTTNSASQVLKAAEGVAGDLTSLTKKTFVGVIHGVQDVTAAIGNAILDNARGTVKGVGLVGADVGAVAKGAALGLIYGSAEVGCELGKVCKSNALSAIQGAGQVTAQLGTMTKDTAVGVIKGTTEVLSTSRALFRGGEKKLEEPGDPNIPVSTNILSVAPVVVATVGPKRSKGT